MTFVNSGELTSVELAKLYWDAVLTQRAGRNLPPGQKWEGLIGWYRKDLIDRSQTVIDGLRSMGVIHRKSA